MAKKKFVVYEVWSKARVVEAESLAEALEQNEPSIDPARLCGLNLGNWHAVPVLETGAAAQPSS